MPDIEPPQYIANGWDLDVLEDGNGIILRFGATPLLRTREVPKMVHLPGLGLQMEHVRLLHAQLTEILAESDGEAVRKN